MPVDEEKTVSGVRNINDTLIIMGEYENGMRLAMDGFRELEFRAWQNDAPDLSSEEMFRYETYIATNTMLRLRNKFEGVKYVKATLTAVAPNPAVWPHALDSCVILEESVKRMEATYIKARFTLVWGKGLREDGSIV